MQFNEGSDRFLQPTIPELWKFCCFLDEINTEIKEDFEQFFVTRKGFLTSKKYKKNTLLSTMTTTYI